MTESFRVPEPSEAAIEAYWCEREGQARITMMLHAAYAVDVPAIVRAEVERFARVLPMPLTVAQRKWVTVYLSTRFPEAAPELECPCGNPDKNGVHYLDHRSPCKPTPSAPAERGSVIAQSGGDCDVCNRPHVELSSVVRFADSVGHKEFYICRACLARVPAGPSAAEEAAAELNDALAGARPEAGKDSTATGVRACKHGVVLLSGIVCEACMLKAAQDCTACPCARCTAEREFVRVFAKWMREDGIATFHRVPPRDLLSAAHCVVEAK